MTRSRAAPRKSVKDLGPVGASEESVDLEARVLDPTSSTRSAPVGRLVLVGQAAKSKASPAALLTLALSAMRRDGASVRYLVTPGGFIRHAIEESWRGDLGWSSSAGQLMPLQDAASDAISTVMSQLPKDAAELARYATIGVDVSTEGGRPRAPFAELVAVWDMVKGRVVHWTARSYPTAEQETRLIQQTDLSSHNFVCDRDRILLLGCHDLTAFSPKGNVNATPGRRRDRRIRAMQETFAAFGPTLVLHHPHTTDTAQSWRSSWSGLQTHLDGIDAWVSGIRWRNPNGAERQPMRQVLSRTHGAGVQPLDVIVADSKSMADAL